MMTYEDHWAPPATMGDAHAEWHRNSGVPMGLPGCPQDACHTDYLSRSEVKRLTRQRDINFAHMRGEVGSATIACAHCHGIHLSIAYVRACAGVNAPTVAPERAPEPMPEISVDDAVAKMRAAMEAKEAEEKAAARARYAAWRTIPVGTGDYANYALERDGSVGLYQIQRPSKGDHRGKTFVKRHSGDGLVKMGWVESGEVMDAIAADPMAAAVLYGRKSQRCAICHRRLTDDKTKGPDGLTSLQRGIGPKCAQKVS